MSSADDEKIKKFREEIDAIDRQICELINRRGQCAVAIGEAKGPNRPKYVPSREREVFDRVAGFAEEPVTPAGLRVVFREIVSLCRGLEERPRVAFLGPEGSFTHNAALARFGAAVELVPARDIVAIFREVEAGRCDYGVAPVENSIEGVVNTTLDHFIESPLQICGEVLLRIEQNLITHASELSAIERVYSHPQGFAQTRVWLDEHLPNADRLEVASTSEAVRIAASDPKAAGISGASAAKYYETPILQACIQDTGDNFTRFVVVGNQSTRPTGRDKTMLMFWLGNEAGALYNVLEPFSQHNVNMTKIVSRPSKVKNWEYIFYVDIVGHAEDDTIREVLAKLRARGASVRILGSFPQAIQEES